MGSELEPTAPGGQWVKGQSGNPAGRPKGKKNEITDLQQDLELAVRRSLDASKIVKIVSKLVTMAEEGNLKAAKLLLDKIIPNAKPEEDGAGDNAGIRIIIENATFASNQNPVDAIDVTPVEVNTIEHRS